MAQDSNLLDRRTEGANTSTLVTEEVVTNSCCDILLPRHNMIVPAKAVGWIDCCSMGNCTILVLKHTEQCRKKKQNK